jgi:cytidylate kinase
MKMMVAGRTASGKTTLARALAAHAGADYVSGSALRAQYLGLGDEVVTRRREYWLEDDEALAADQHRLEPGSAERSFDEFLASRYATSLNVVFDVWFLPWLFDGPAGVRIYVDAPLALRAARAARQAHAANDQAILDAVTAKDARAIEYGRTAYGVDIETDASPFDMIVRSTDTVSVDELAVGVMECIEGNHGSSGAQCCYTIEPVTSGDVVVTCVARGSDKWHLAQS